MPDGNGASRLDRIEKQIEKAGRNSDRLGRARRVKQLAL
jgi:hypothetical protein